MTTRRPLSPEFLKNHFLISFESIARHQGETIAPLISALEVCRDQLVIEADAAAEAGSADAYRDILDALGHVGAAVNMMKPYA